MHPLQRQRPFLQSVLREKNDHLGQERLQRANADQINALSLLALNLLKGNIPMRHYTKKQLQLFATMLHTLHFTVILFHLSGLRLFPLNLVCLFVCLFFFLYIFSLFFAI